MWFDENGLRTQIAEPSMPEDVEPDDPHVRAGLDFIADIMRWIFSPPCDDLNGLHCRIAAAQWILVPEFHEFTLTAWAGRVGKSKQSVGRAVCAFKREFPHVAKFCPHLRWKDRP